MQELSTNQLTNIKMWAKWAVVDHETGLLGVIDEAHLLRHLGEIFHMGVNTDSATSINIAFKTGAKELHMEYQFSTEGKAHFSILKAASWTTNTGTAVAVDNAKQNEATKTTDILEDKTATPTFTATQKYLQTVTSPSGTELKGFTEYTFAAKPFSGSARRADGEIILAPTTAYVFLLTSDSGGAQGLGMNLAYYGVTPDA